LCIQLQLIITIDERIEEISGLILTLERESRKLVTEKFNHAKTAERYTSCYEIVERIILLLFNHLDIPVKSGRGVNDSQDIHEALLESLNDPKNPLHLFLGHGASNTFLHDANDFRGRWRNRPRKDTSMLRDTRAKSSMAEGFKQVEDSLWSGLQAMKKEVERRENGDSLWDHLRNKEIVLTMKEEGLLTRERKLEKWEEEGEPRIEKIRKQEKELEQVKETFEKEMERFHTEQAQYRYERSLDVEDLEREREQIELQRHADAEQLRLCYMERANDHKELEVELLKTQKARLDLQTQAEAERIEAREQLENETLKTQNARAELEVRVGSLQAMIVSYRKSRMQQESSEQSTPEKGRVEDDLTLMITKLLADLIQAELEREGLEMEKQNLLSEVDTLKAQLPAIEQFERPMILECLGENYFSIDEEGTVPLELESGDDNSDDSSS